MGHPESRIPWKLVSPWLSVTFYFMKNSFSDISRKCILPNVIGAVNRLHSLHWSIHTKDESKRGTALAFIFGVNWLRRCCVTTSFGVFFFSWNRMTSFMEFMHIEQLPTSPTQHRQYTRCNTASAFCLLCFLPFFIRGCKNHLGIVNVEWWKAY